MHRAINGYKLLIIDETRADEPRARHLFFQVAFRARRGRSLFNHHYVQV
jgi:hypothetical protein